MKNGPAYSRMWHRLQLLLGQSPSPTLQIVSTFREDGKHESRVGLVDRPDVAPVGDPASTLVFALAGTKWIRITTEP